MTEPKKAKTAPKAVHKAEETPADGLVTIQSGAERLALTPEPVVFVNGRARVTPQVARVLVEHGHATIIPE